jgi:hypothetical protein
VTTDPLWMLVTWAVFTIDAGGLKFWRLTTFFRKHLLGNPSPTERFRHGLKRIWKKDQQYRMTNEARDFILERSTDKIPTMFPTKNEKWIHERIPKIVMPLVWISSVFYLTELHNDSALGVFVMFASFFGIPLLMSWIMRIGEFNAIESLVKGLEYAERRGDYQYGGKNFNRRAKEFILGWWGSNSKSYLK